jgi:hypothetical protein
MPLRLPGPLSAETRKMNDLGHVYAMSASEDPLGWEDAHVVNVIGSVFGIRDAGVTLSVRFVVLFGTQT